MFKENFYKTEINKCFVVSSILGHALETVFRFVHMPNEKIKDLKTMKR